MTVRTLAFLVCVLFGVFADRAVATDSAVDEANQGAAKMPFPVLLAQKRILTKEIIVGERIEVEIELFNIGTSPAENIVVEDGEWDSSIQVADGDKTHSVARLGMYETTKVRYTMNAPSAEGEYRGGPAKISYRRGVEEKPKTESDETEESDVVLDENISDKAPDAVDTKVYVSYSTQIYEDAELPYDRLNADGTLQPRGTGKFQGSVAGKLRVLSRHAFNQRHAHHIKEGILFLVLLLVPVGLPFYFYYIRSKELELALLCASQPSPSQSPVSRK